MASLQELGARGFQIRKRLLDYEDVIFSYIHVGFSLCLCTNSHGAGVVFLTHNFFLYE